MLNKIRNFGTLSLKKEDRFAKELIILRIPNQNKTLNRNHPDQ